MQCRIKQAVTIALYLFLAGPALAGGHCAGSTAPMCSTCTHRPLCRFAELFSCHKSNSKQEPKHGLPAADGPTGR